MTVYYGDSGDNSIVGGDDDDSFAMYDGGTDTVFGGGGGDNFFFGATLTTDDRIDGGDGVDYLHIQGDYSAGVTLGAGVFTNVEGFVLDQSGGGGPVDYNITMDDSALSGGGLYVVANAHTTFDAGAETDASYYFVAGVSGDQVTTGAGDDIFHLNLALTNADHYDGGAGFDTVELGTGVSTTMTPQNIENIEKLVLFTNNGNFDLTFVDQDVAAGQTLEIDASGSDRKGWMTINGSAERDGNFLVNGGTGSDLLIGGRGDDTLNGGLGSDTLRGGVGADVLDGSGGSDHFLYSKIGESLVRSSDTIVHLQDIDVIDLSAIDADTTTDGDQAFHLVKAFSHVAGQAVLSFDGTNTTLQMDVDGDGKADMAIGLEGDRRDFSNFVL
jgi:Ca2+-binding RTX toxin-like protein